MNLIHSGSEFQALLLLIVLNQTDKMGMRAIKAIFGEHMPKMHRFQNTSNYPKLPEIRICGRLTVFAGVCGFFCGRFAGRFGRRILQNMLSVPHCQKTTKSAVFSPLPNPSTRQHSLGVAPEERDQAMDQCSEETQFG